MSEETPKTETPAAPLPSEQPTTPDPKAGPAPKMKPIKIRQKAILEWRETEKGEIKETEESFRSTFALLKHLFKKLTPESPQCKWWLEIYLQIEPDADEKVEGDTKIYVYRGEAIGAIAMLMQKTIPPQIMLMELQRFVGQLAERSSLKGIVITAVCEDAQAGGIGLLSESVEVTDEDIKVLGESAANQAEMFKDGMRKARGIRFPSDSNIVTASSIPKSLRFPGK